MPSRSSNFRHFFGLLNAYSFSDHPQPNNFVGLLGAFSSTGHSTPLISWTCSALSLLLVIQHQYFRGPARHFLFFWSFSTANFMDLLSTFSSSGHSAPLISWTWFALTFIPVICNSATDTFFKKIPHTGVARWGKK